MIDLEQEALRDGKGRFVPGHSGNPAGKKPGTRNRATALREALRDGEDCTVARIVIDKALAGDAVAARFIVDRLTPRPRGRAIALDLPEGETAGDVLAASLILSRRERECEQDRPISMPTSCIPPAFCSRPARSRTGRREVPDVAPELPRTHF